MNPVKNAIECIGRLIDHHPRSLSVIYSPNPEAIQRRVKIILHINSGPYDSQTIEVNHESLEMAVIELYETLKRRLCNARQRLEDIEKWVMIMHPHLESMQKNTLDIPPNTQG